MYDLPMIARNEYMGREIRNSLGQIEDVDLDKGEIEWGEYMRVRIKLDISKP